jgi:hypothetical protein
VALEYFTEAELRALPQMSDTAVYTTARIDAAAAYMVSIFERFCGVSFISRSATETYSGTDANQHARSIVLARRRPIAVTALTQDGTAFTAGEIAELKVSGGVVRRYLAGTVTPYAWNEGIDNLVVTYTAGFSAVPGDVKEAALKGTRAHLLATNSNATLDDRRTSMNTEMGTVNYVIAGEDRPTGYPEVDAVLLGYRASRSPLVF